MLAHPTPRLTKTIYVCETARPPPPPPQVLRPGRKEYKFVVVSEIWEDTQQQQAADGGAEWADIYALKSWTIDDAIRSTLTTPRPGGAEEGGSAISPTEIELGMGGGGTPGTSAPATPTATPPASPPKPARYVASTPAAASPERGATDLGSPVVGSTVPVWVLEQHTQMVHATLPRNKGSRTEATPTAKPNASGALPTVGTPAAPAGATARAQPQVAPPLVLPLAGVQGGGRKLEALQHRAAPKPAAVGTMRMEDMLRSAMMAAASDERKTKAFEEMLQRYREHPGVVRRKQEEEAARKQRMEVVNRACYWSEKKRIPEGVRPNHKLLDDFVAVSRM